MVRERAKSFLPHSYGEVPASYAGDGVMSHGLWPLTPPSRLALSDSEGSTTDPSEDLGTGTSPSEWGGC